MSYETVLYDVSDHVATLTLNRPEVMNAFNQRMCEEIQDVWMRARLDDDVRVVVVQANGGRAFSVGVDRKNKEEGSSSGTGFEKGRLHNEPADRRESRQGQKDHKRDH